MPSTRPTTSAMVAAVAPACRDDWAPQITRLSTSRPNSSVPIRCARLGGCRSTRKSCLIGLYGLTWPAKTAAAMTTSNTIVPATPVFECRKRRRAAAQGVTAGRTLTADPARPGSAGRLSGSDETATAGIANARTHRRLQHGEDHGYGDDADRHHHHRSRDDGR